MNTKNYRLVEARETLNYSQYKMANKLDMVVNSYNMKENGKRQFTVEEANKICIILGKNYDELFK
jgi:DNA-binding XRE family transcriptional regulator